MGIQRELSQRQSYPLSTYMNSQNSYWPNSLKQIEPHLEGIELEVIP
jgi:hypothetical protein